MSPKPRIAVIYYSINGHIATLAKAVAEGVRAAEAEATLLHIPETFTPEILGKMGAVPRDGVQFINNVDDLTQYDGFIFGIPTRYGRAVAQVSAFFDRTGGLWGKGALLRKFGGVFTSTASQHGGQETTALTTIPFFAHHGIIYVPVGYRSFAELTVLSQVEGGTPWGASTIAGGDGSRQPSEIEIKLAQAQGKDFAEVVGQFIRGGTA